MGGVRSVHEQMVAWLTERGWTGPDEADEIADEVCTAFSVTVRPEYREHLAYGRAPSGRETS